MDIISAIRPRVSPQQWLNSLVWLLLLTGTGLLLFNIAFYASYGLNHPFILEKSAVADRVWLVCLVIHIPASAVCLVAGLMQWLPIIRRHWPTLHKRLGRLYVLMVLLPLTPTGMYLGLFAKGGLIGKSAFLLMGLALLGSTWLGVQCAMRRNIPAHKRWMARSFALAAVAVTFRFVHIALHEIGLPAQTNYVIATWASIFLNLILAEVLVSRSYWLNRFQKENSNDYAITTV